MPYYMARGVSARLGAMPLADTTSPEIIKNHKTEKFEKLLQTSKLLNEMPVPFPGDNGQHRLNWLGDAPFIQVQASLNGSREQCPSTKKASIGPNDQEVKALVLHVNLSDRTYISGLSGKKTSLKIEVFFNGQLCHCRLITLHDVRSGVRGPHQIFAGTRVDSYAERPWVILPPGMAPDGSFETNYNSVSVPQRWQDICEALHSEARKRGANQEGEVPPTAQFLEALAIMQMPGQVHNVQKPGGKVFGTVDVVITAGEGRKVQTGQQLVKEPKRMPDKRYTLTGQSDNLAADLQILHDKQNSSHVERQSPEPDTGLSNLYADGDCHQEQGSHSEHASGFSIHRRTGPPSSLELTQPKSDCHVPDDAQYSDVNSEHQYLGNPSGSYQNVFQDPQMPRVHSSDTARGPSTLTFPNGKLALVNAAPHTRSLDAIHNNRNGPNYPPLINQVGGVGVGLQQLGPSMLPMPYWSPREPPQGFDYGQFSFRSETPLEASGRSPTGVEGFAPVSYSTQMAPSLVSHDVPRWPLMPGASFIGRLTGPLPPVGLYSVPTKPNRGAISQKKPVPIQSKKSVSVISLRRLVILGQNKTILVERQWDPSKRLEVGLTTLVSAESQPNLPESTNSPLELIKHKDALAAICELVTTVAQPSASSNEESAQPGPDPARGVLPSSTSIPCTKAPQHPVCNEPFSKSSTRKKSMTDHDTAVDKPQSFLNSKAPRNPPLNQGCVIAYAESQDKDNEQGIVRQTRAERAGHFEENYVIFATRFFVGEG